MLGFKWLKKIDLKYPWSLLGVILAVAFFVYGLYFSLGYNKPKIAFDIIRESNMVDVNYNAGDLKILYNDNIINTSKLNLKLIQIKIENVGNTDILQSLFAQDDMWGFKVNQGTIVEERLIYTNSDYISKYLMPIIYRNNMIKFNKILFERGKYFIIEVLVIHNKEGIPEIFPIGKIAGIDNVITRNTWKDKEEGKLQKRRENYFSNMMWDAPFDIHMGRFLIYSGVWVVLFLIVLGILFPLFGFHEKIMRNRRSKDIRLLLKEYPLKDDSKATILVEMFIEQGPEVLTRFDEFMKNKDALAKTIRFCNETKIYEDKMIDYSNKASTNNDETTIGSNSKKIHWNLSDMLERIPLRIDYTFINKMVNEGVISINEKDEIKFDVEFDNVLAFLNKHKKLYMILYRLTK